MEEASMGGRSLAWWVLLAWLLMGAPALAQDEDLFEEAKEVEPEEEAAPSEGGGEQAGDEERPPGEEEETTEETDAPAEAEPVEESGHPAPISIGVLIGYGISLEDGPANPWGVGFGLRGGYNISDFYVGVRFSYHLGETAEIPTADVFGVGGTEEVTVNLWDLGAEAGYDIHAGTVIIRPELGIGFAGSSYGSSSELNPYLAPGAALLVDLGGFFVGLDARFQAVLSDPSTNAIGIFGTLGMRF
jgi:hypothetical protein